MSHYQPTPITSTFMVSDSLRSQTKKFYKDSEPLEYSGKFNQSLQFYTPSIEMDYYSFIKQQRKKKLNKLIIAEAKQQRDKILESTEVREKRHSSAGYNEPFEQPAMDLEAADKVRTISSQSQYKVNLGRVSF